MDIYGQKRVVPGERTGEHLHRSGTLIYLDPSSYQMTRAAEEGERMVGCETEKPSPTAVAETGKKYVVERRCNADGGEMVDDGDLVENTKRLKSNAQDGPGAEGIWTTKGDCRAVGDGPRLGEAKKTRDLQGVLQPVVKYSFGTSK